MVRLEWIEDQLKRIRHETCTMQTIRDYAALLIVRDSLHGKEASPSHVDHFDDFIDDFNKMPTLDQVEKALGAVMVQSESQKKRKEDAMTWAKILQGE